MLPPLSWPLLDTPLPLLGQPVPPLGLLWIRPMQLRPLLPLKRLLLVMLRMPPTRLLKLLDMWLQSTPLTSLRPTTITPSLT
jgi:hypothetical protein